MQFHLNGFEPGDPEILDLSERYPASGAIGSVPKEVDVLIVGGGPAGLTLAAHCAARVHHSAELRALEGDNLFDTLTTYRAVAERLAREGRLAHVLFVAQKPA